MKYKLLLLHRVPHHRNEFVAAKTMSTALRVSGASAKFRMTKLRGVRREKLLRHLKECERRWNHRGKNLYRILLSNFRKKPLSAT